MRNDAVPPAIEAALKLGHELVNDPPHALSRMGRMTCSVCGDAVLVRGDGSGYGSATERECHRLEPGQLADLFEMLGGGLDVIGKHAWLNGQRGQTFDEMRGAALELQNGQVAT